MIEVSINQSAPSKVTLDKDAIQVNDKPVTLDIKAIDAKFQHVVYQNKTYNVELVSVDFNTKNLTLKVNGKTCEIEIKDKLDLLLQKLGLEQGDASAMHDLKAPMPGLILEVLVQPGQEVQKGQPLVILEAMKMENVLKASGDGLIKAITVNKGDSVEKNSVLVQF